jgi:hypothetical protein
MNVLGSLKTMEKLKKAINHLIHGNYFDSVLEHIYAIALTLFVFVAIGYIFVFKPVVLFYLLIASMLVMGWFMMYLLFPKLYDQFQTMVRSAIRFLRQFINR